MVVVSIHSVFSAGSSIARSLKYTSKSKGSKKFFTHLCSRVTSEIIIWNYCPKHRLIEWVLAKSLFWSSTRPRAGSLYSKNFRKQQLQNFCLSKLFKGIDHNGRLGAFVPGACDYEMWSQIIGAKFVNGHINYHLEHIYQQPLFFPKSASKYISEQIFFNFLSGRICHQTPQTLESVPETHFYRHAARTGIYLLLDFKS